jgi:hypothetical protein
LKAKRGSILSSGPSANGSRQSRLKPNHSQEKPKKANGGHGKFDGDPANRRNANGLVSLFQAAAQADLPRDTTNADNAFSLTNVRGLC